MCLLALGKQLNSSGLELMLQAVVLCLHTAVKMVLAEQQLTESTSVPVTLHNKPTHSPLDLLKWSRADSVYPCTPLFLHYFLCFSFP